MLSYPTHMLTKIIVDYILCVSFSDLNIMFLRYVLIKNIIKIEECRYILNINTSQTHYLRLEATCC